MRVTSIPLRALPAPDPIRPDHHLKAAEGLLRAKGYEPKDHVILGENVASYLANLSPYTKHKLRGREPQDLLHVLESYCPERFARKIVRDLAVGGSDGEVFDHLQKLDRGLQAKAREVVERSGPNSLIAVAGGVNRGRFGLGSDVDALTNGKRPWFWKTDCSKVHISEVRPKDWTQQLGFFSGARVVQAELLANCGGIFTNAFILGLESKGYKVRLEAGDVKVERPVGPIRRPVEPQDRGRPIPFSLSTVKDFFS